jgi:hypothetical protein
MACGLLSSYFDQPMFVGYLLCENPFGSDLVIHVLTKNRLSLASGKAKAELAGTADHGPTGIQERS